MGRARKIDDRLPAYARLRDALVARITDGEWTAERPIHAEARLARDYGVSIGTVRKAVDGLVSEGLLERRQGSGTFLRAPRFDATLFRFFQFRGADGSALPIPSSTLVARSAGAAPAEAAAALGTDRTIHVVRLRSLSNGPVLFEDIHVPAHRFDGFERLEEAVIGPLLYPLYFERYGILVKRATDDLTFASAAPPVADRLGITAGDAVAEIRRTAFDIEDVPVEWRIARGPASRFHYRSEIG
jgi:GntR family transcriptional regulator